MPLLERQDSGESQKPGIESRNDGPLSADAPKESKNDFTFCMIVLYRALVQPPPFPSPLMVFFHIISCSSLCTFCQIQRRTHGLQICKKRKEEAAAHAAARAEIRLCSVKTNQSILQATKDVLIIFKMLTTPHFLLLHLLCSSDNEMRKCCTDMMVL